MQIQKVSNINLNEYKPNRAGIIPYTFNNGQLYIGLGVDSKYHEFTDFSGTIDHSQENCIEGAIREFKEETLSVFKDINERDLQDYYAICSDKMMVIFVGFNVKKDLVPEKFKRNFKNAKKPEICAIVWFIPESFQSLICEGDKMFKKLKDLLYSARLYDYEILKTIF